MDLSGFELIECNPKSIPLKLKPSDIPNRKHRSKRIQKKWIKRYGFKMISYSQIFIIGNKIFGSKENLEKIKTQ